MKFSTKQIEFRKSKKNWRYKNISVLISRSGGNIFLYIGYNSPYKNNLPVSHSTSRETGCGEEDYNLQINLYQGDTALVVNIIPENDREKKFLNNALVHFMECDYCDTQILLTPPVTWVQWEKAIALKEVK